MWLSLKVGFPVILLSVLISTMSQKQILFRMSSIIWLQNAFVPCLKATYVCFKGAEKNLGKVRGC